MLSPSVRRPRSSHKAITFIVAVLAGLALGNIRGGIVGVAHAASGTSGTVTVQLSNRSARNAKACKATGVTHVWVTVKDVRIHQSGKRRHGWHDITPDLAAAPVQIDLLADAPGAESGETPVGSDCALTTLGQGTSGLPAGKYQQLRVILVLNGDSPAPSTNACAADLGATVYNCVELSDGSFQPLVTRQAWQGTRSRHRSRRMSIDRSAWRWARPWPWPW